ncbi:MAG: hypothetical protein HZA52_04300 [Planctomycetes bacterium]|nr:hypothetical protein [Planctomycetota bacterium]
MATTSVAQVPTDVQLPGTQPKQAIMFDGSPHCEQCHFNFDPAREPGFAWTGSAMAQSTRDPLFFAATAIAEQDFPGAGDLCLRCHSPLGFFRGHLPPSDGSALTTFDFDGVTCHICHRTTDPDNSENPGVQYAPYLAHDKQSPPHAYVGAGESVLWYNSERLGPYYTGVTPPHVFRGSAYQRSTEHCGTCHDVSNPVVGDLAHNHGATAPLAPGSFSGVPGSPVAGKAAFNNFPYAYGVVERTFSEHESSPLASVRVGNYATLPSDLRAGAIERAYVEAIASTPAGDFEDGTQRFFTCQTCHMRPLSGKGASPAAAVSHADLATHDLTGGNYWINDATVWLNDQGRLVDGNILTATHKAAMTAANARALGNLDVAASLTVSGRTVRVTNLTGHKLISGYPEGRRMWLRVRWHDLGGALMRTDGEYGTISAQVGAQFLQVETILDPSAPNTRIWEAQMGLTSEWAQQLLALGIAAGFVLEYDRVTGAPSYTLGDLGAQAPGTTHASFHFALANAMVKDNRIPPWRMRYDDAHTRNILPVPPTQSGAPGPGGEFEHFDDVELVPPPGAVHASIELLYQPTSWEYVQFLALANDGSVAHLAATGQAILDAWLATGMAAPHVMATASWDWTPPTVYCTSKVNSLGCTPAVSCSGVPAVGLSSGFVIRADQELNQRHGLLFYGINGASAQPYFGGWQCVAPPVIRTLPQNSGGSALPTHDCSGVYTYDFNTRIASGVDPTLVQGRMVWAQYWSRDQASLGGTNPSDALEFTIE